MMIEGKIINRDNKKKIDLLELKNSKLSNIIYGVGSYAEDIMKLFHKLEIRIDGACVDGEYMSQSSKLFHGMEVIALTDVCKKYVRFNIIIAYANYIDANHKVKKIDNVETVYFIDAPHTVDFFNYKYVIDNLNEFEYTYSLLQDDQSKETFIAYINSKISGDPYSLRNVITGPQYFNDIIPFGANDIFVDCGAFTGGYYPWF